MTDKQEPKVFDMEVRKELKETKVVADKAVGDLYNVTMSREELIAENLVLKEQVKHLEGLLVHKDSVKDISLKSHEEEIILVEFKRMYDVHVLGNQPLVDTDDIKKLKLLVESLSIIRNGQKPKKVQEKQLSVEEAFETMRLVKEEG
jgi:hypothetical protein